MALDSYFKEGDARKEREYIQAKRDAELSVLGDKTAADRSGYQLKAGENTQGLELLPGATANKKTAQGIETADLNAKAARQPKEIATANAKAEVAKALADFDVADLPRVIAEKQRAGIFSEADAGVAAVVKLSDLVKAGDPNKIVTFMNAMNDINPPEKRKAPVATVGVGQGANGEKTFVAKDAAGNTVFQISAAQMQAVRDSVAKTEVKTVNAGDSVVTVKDGKVTPVYTAPESDKSRSAKTGPLERDVGYLMKSHNMSQQEALGYLNSAKTMSRQQFILKSTQDKIAMGGKPTDTDIAEFGRIYDRAQAKPGLGTPTPGTPGSNNAPTGTVDPQIKSLLGLP